LFKNNHFFAIFRDIFGQKWKNTVIVSNRAPINGAKWLKDARLADFAFDYFAGPEVIRN